MNISVCSTDRSLGRKAPLTVLHCAESANGTLGLPRESLGRRVHQVLICCALLSFALSAGCHWGLGLPDHAKASGYDPNVQYEDGWLFRRATGQPVTRRTDGAPNQTEAAPSGDRDITRVSHEPGVPDRQRDELRTTVVEEEEKPFLEKLDPIENFKKLVTPRPNERIARALFSEGTELYRRSKYEEAAEKFDKAAARWPDSILEEDALFMQAESEFFADDYPKANETYDELLTKYEYTKYLDRAVARQFAIGRYWDQLETADPALLGIVQLTDSTRPKFDTWRRSLKAYETVRLHDPTGPLADSSILATANSYFVRGRNQEAAYYYDLLRREYPQSEHIVHAYLLGMKANLLSYQGPLYDGTPLEKAEQMATELLLLYPEKLGEDREKVLHEKNRIHEAKAARDWAVGQYYDRRKYYGAARYYYRLLIEDYPNTEAAQLALRRLDEIAGLPDKPPDHFTWLTRWFPSPSDE